MIPRLIVWLVSQALTHGITSGLHTTCAPAREIIAADLHIDAVVDQSAALPCHSTATDKLDWKYTDEDNSHTVEIARGNTFIDKWVGRARIDSDGHGNFKLVILQPMTDDSGIYTCCNDTGFGHEYRVRLSVRDKVSAETRMVKYSTSVGQPVMLPCHTILNDSVDWTYNRINSTRSTSSADDFQVINSGVLVDSWRERVRVESSVVGEYSLILVNPQIRDTGVYSCIEKSGLGQQHAIILTVTENNTCPTFTTVASDLVALSCTLSVNSTRWYINNDKLIYNGRALGDTSGRMHVYYTSDRLINVLLIRQVSHVDVGTYSCNPGNTVARRQYFVVTSPIAGIDDCLVNNGGCHRNAACMTLPGGVRCVCMLGFTGNGLGTCDDIDECSANNGGCNRNATCTNVPGSFHCACFPGLSGDGRICDVMPVAELPVSHGITECNSTVHSQQSSTTPQPLFMYLFIASCVIIAAALVVVVVILVHRLRPCRRGQQAGRHRENDDNLTPPEVMPMVDLGRSNV